MGKRLYSEERERVRRMLKAVRSAAALSQVELAAKLARPQSYVSDYERGHRRLDWVAVVEVLDACQYDLVDFARGFLAGGRIDASSKNREA